MDNLLETALQSQTIFGGIHFLVFLFSWPFVIGYLKDYHDSSTFNCLPKPSDYTRQRCYHRYVSTLNPHFTPLDFAGITFGILGIFWACFIITGGWLKQRIGNEQDVQRRRGQTCKFLLAFTCHVCLQFFVLVVMLGLFCGYQTLEFPAEYWCTQGNITLSPTNQVLASNMTCNDLRYKEKSKLNNAIIGIMTVSIFFCLLTMLHLGIKKKVFLGQLIGNINDPDNEQLVGLDEEPVDTAEESVDASGTQVAEEPVDVNVTQLAAVKEYSENLKASVKRDTEFQPQLINLNLSTPVRMKTDEIFTNLRVQHERKPVEDKTNADRATFLKDYGQVAGTRIKHHQEIFFRKSDGESEIPKSILVTGKAGIGKSMFCQKLIRDWANDKLFGSSTNESNEFKTFVYLMSFRDLNSLRDNISLRELLNCSSVSDDRSNVDDLLLEYIRSHSKEVFIIIDGFDEYSQQDYIAGDAHKCHPNSAQDKMPVAALCAKLMRGKILGNATVIITSRPNESNKLSGFDRVVEITGFSPTEVEEYITKYFSENDTMKNTVLDHIMKNEELVSCAHIPVLCALMCSYMEYVLNESNNPKGLPLSISELYCEVLKIFETKHNNSKRSECDKTSLTDKLSEFAANLLKEKEFVFGEERMKYFTSEEVEFLRTCGLLHWGPLFRKEFSKTTRHVTFTHLTVQEYLAACCFVKTREVPAKGTVSSMVLQFMAGILSKEKDSRDLMVKLLKELPSPNAAGNENKYLLEAKCLSEYRDSEFAADYHRDDGLEKEIHFRDVNNLDAVAIHFWLDAVTKTNDHCRVLRIQEPNLTLRRAVERICKALGDNCSITELRLVSFQLNDDWLPSVITLMRNQLSSLELLFTVISDNGVTSLCEALQHSDCKVTRLKLEGDQITDAVAARLSKVLQHSDCKVTSLYLWRGQITDVGVATLSKALQHSDCKVTKLELDVNQISDVGVASLSEAMKHPDWKVTKLLLKVNQITDVGVASLSEALQHSDCKVTRLELLSSDQITDVGIACLSKALQHPDCKVSKLRLNNNKLINPSDLTAQTTGSTTSC